MNARTELTRVQREINNWRNDSNDHTMRQVMWDWVQTIDTVVRESLPVELAKPADIKAMLRAGGVPVTVAAREPYAPLTPEEVQALSCMVWGAPCTGAQLHDLGVVAATLLALVATGERPIDPATLPSWEPEQQLQWLASTGRRVGRGSGRYWVVNPDGDVTVSAASVGEAVQTAMRAAFKAWADGATVVTHQQIDWEHPRYCVGFDKADNMGERGPWADSEQGALLAAWPITWGAA